MHILIDRDPRLKHGPLEKDPVVVVVNDFTEESARKFREDLNKAALAGMPIVPVVIDSYGGNAHALLSMIEAVKSCPVPVATICEGKAMSCGAMLLAMGARGHRYASRFGTIMVHRVSSLAYGTTPVLKADAAETARIERVVFDIVAEHCGIAREDLMGPLHDREGADWFLTAPEAVAAGLVDRVGVPTLKVTAAVAMELEL